MMDSHDIDEIIFKVTSDNIANDIINFATPKIINALKIYEGQQILKQDYTLLKKIENVLNPILKETQNKFKDIKILYFKCSEYSIYLNIGLRFNEINKKNGFMYYDSYKYICDIKELKIKSFYEFKEIEHINLIEQLDIFQNCNNLLEQFKTEKAKLRPYSLNDMRVLR